MRKHTQLQARLLAPLRAGHLPRQQARFDAYRDRREYAIIVLDALRYDYARDILPQYFQGDLEAVWSAGHDTFEYGRRVWGDREYSDVTYVSGAVPLNSQADQDVFDIQHFNDLYEGWVPRETLPGLVDAWRQLWDDDLGTVPPEALTEYARDYTTDERLVVHYLQPHAPYVGSRSLLGHTEGRDARPNEGAPVDEPVWEAVRDGRITQRELEAAYRANVHRACQAIQGLVADVLEDRPVVVTSDHGELLGDYGRDYVSHPRVPYPEVRRVPWLRVEGVCGGPDPESDAASDSVKAKLEALGYA